MECLFHRYCKTGSCSSDFSLFLCFCTEGEILNATVEASKLDYHIKDLKALTDYRISVEVTYFSFTTLRSEYLEVTTNRNYSLIHTEDFKGNIVFRCWKHFVIHV